MLYAPLLFMETKLLSETLGVAITLLALALLLKAVEVRRPGVFFVAGLVTGLSTLCRSANLLFVITVLVWLCVRAIIHRDRAHIGSLVSTAMGIALAILPVTIRNYVVGQDIALIQTNLGMTFAQGNNEKAVGVICLPPGTSAGIASQQQEEMAMAERALGHPVKPSGSSRYWLQQGVGWIRENPAAYLLLLGRKLMHSFTNREELDSYEIYYEISQVPILRCLFLPFSIILGLAVVGLIQGRREGIGQGGRLLVLYVLSVLVTLLVFYVSPRYRMPGGLSWPSLPGSVW